ncbi:hypothetical protein [Shewanella surugensis]|uniref:Uncharacterized protein n=1 Tax=Shewanella surugensis TaxID=212020 RepID=A0ABT0LCV4_9GAMM|nr:hypothetical protein [Shewanella surugensis]MCL1125528.1 hypothetical protein [Shewanella surugensis]
MESIANTSNATLTITNNKTTDVDVYIIQEGGNINVDHSLCVPPSAEIPLDGDRGIHKFTLPAIAACQFVIVANHAADSKTKVYKSEKD